MAFKPNTFIDGRPFPVPDDATGKGYDFQLQSRAQSILNTLMSLRSSTYGASIPSTEYANYFRAMAFELARFTLALETYADNISYDQVQSEYIQQIVGYLVFVNNQTPILNLNDEDFRKFLLTVIDIYFQGSTPEAIRDGVALFTNLPITIRENYIDARRPGSLYDISDQFGFRVEVEISGNNFPPEIFTIESNVRILLDLIRPAHTLYNLGFVIRDGADDGGGSNGNTESFLPFKDALRWDMYWYNYDDLRKYCEGMAGFESDEGQILSLNSFQDLTKPISKVSPGATLTIFEGYNTGQYLVLGFDPATQTLKVHPSFKRIEVGVSYHVEGDRLGENTEREVLAEPHTLDYQEPRLEVLAADVSGPAGGPILLEVTTNVIGAEIRFDLNADGVFETLGSPALHVAPLVVGTYAVYFEVSTPAGQYRRSTLLVESL